MQTFKHGTPEAQYPDVYTDTFIFFSDHFVKLYGWTYIFYAFPEIFFVTIVFVHITTINPFAIIINNYSIAPLCRRIPILKYLCCKGASVSMIQASDRQI